ncbi:MAG: hypothetical protein ACM3KL_06655 [Alphaproteobacteria bacterium]
MADSESVRKIAYSPTPFSTWLGIVCLFILFGLIVLAVIGPSPRGSDYEEARAKKRMERLKALNEENQKQLTTYAWVDKAKGVARIPIDRAMELTVADLAQRTPAPAGPIATPPPAQASPAAAVGSAPPSSAPAGSPTSSTVQPSPQASAPASPQGIGASSPLPAAAISPPPAAQHSPTASSSPAP